MNASDKLIHQLLELEESAVLAQVRQRVRAGEDPLKIIEDAQQAMRLVGERYEKGEYYISSMMMAGEIFREVMEIVEPLLMKGRTRKETGRILLGTVQGDIHDIGKNIFSILLRSHGFTVIDLGVDVPPARFAEQALLIKPDILALSGLLTISYDSMKETIVRVRNLGDKRIVGMPVIIGGGTVNEMVCAFVGADYWASDAMVGTQLCRQIVERKKEGTE